MLLHVNFLSFFLPKGFKGTIADALRLLAEYDESHITSDIEKADWDTALESFPEGKKLTAGWSLSSYDKKTNKFLSL